MTQKPSRKPASTIEQIAVVTIAAVVSIALLTLAPEPARTVGQLVVVVADVGALAILLYRRV